MKGEVELPSPGMVVGVPIEIERPASVCLHDQAKRPMCTIIPLGETPDPEAEGPWILSCWGNGAGIVCFLEAWDETAFFDVEIIETRDKSVIARALKQDGAPDSTSR